MQDVTRSQLALLLKDGKHHIISEHILAGVDPVSELADSTGVGLRKALRTGSRRDLYGAIVRGEINVIED